MVGGGCRGKEKCSGSWTMKAYMLHGQKWKGARRRLSETTGWLRQLRKWSEDFRKNNICEGWKESRGSEMCTGKVIWNTVICPLTTVPSPPIIFNLGGEFKTQERPVLACVYTSYWSIYFCPWYEEMLLLTALLFMCVSGAQSCLINDAQSNPV